MVKGITVRRVLCVFFFWNYIIIITCHDNLENSVLSKDRGECIPTLETNIICILNCDSDHSIVTESEDPINQNLPSSGFFDENFEKPGLSPVVNRSSGLFGRVALTKV